MLSAIVHYLDQNDAGPGFYSLAGQMGLLPKGVTPPEDGSLNDVFDSVHECSNVPVVTGFPFVLVHCGTPVFAGLAQRYLRTLQPICADRGRDRRAGRKTPSPPSFAGARTSGASQWGWSRARCENAGDEHRGKANRGGDAQCRRPL